MSDQETKKVWSSDKRQPFLNVVQGEKGVSVTTFAARPAPALREYIDLYGGEELNLPAYPGLRRPRVHFLPTNAVELHLCYHDTSYVIHDRSRSCRFTSLITGGRNIHAFHHFEVPPSFSKQIHVKFKPGGFYRMFGIPESEIKNTFFTTEEVFGAEGKYLEELLNNTSSFDERISIVDRHFMRGLATRRLRRGDQSVAVALRMIEKSGGNINVSLISKELNISKRTLEWQFTKHVGLSPKEYAMNVRFESVLNGLLTVNSVDWSEMAYANGYFDQSHLIDEFRDATGYSPESFLRENGGTVFKFRGALFIMPRPETDSYSTHRRFKQEYLNATNDSEWR